MRGLNADDQVVVQFGSASSGQFGFGAPGGIGVMMVGSAPGGAQLITPLPGYSQALVTPQRVALALAVSLGIGISFGLYPANRAAALNPIDALRHE